MRPTDVVFRYTNFLTDHEKTEIHNYDTVFFLNLKEEKKNKAQTDVFCNEKGEFNVNVGEHIKFRYEILEKLGMGSFGVVLKCVDHKTKELVGVKVLRNEERFHRQGKVEVRILTRLNKVDERDKKNVVRMFDYFYFRGHLVSTTRALTFIVHHI